MVDFEIRKRGGSKKMRDLSIRCAYDFIQREFNVGRSTARLYMKIYEKFGNDEEALSMLRVESFPS